MVVGVTGTSGFLGKALSKALEKSSIEFVPIQFPKTNEVFDKVFLENLVSNLKVEAVFHLAAVRNPRNRYEFDVNARLPVLFANALKRNHPNIRFIHLSSLNTVLSQRNDSYSVSKRQAEKSLEDTGAIIIRPGIIWSWQANAEGDAGRLRNFLERSLPFHPIPFPGQLYKPLLVEKLAPRIVQLIAEQNPPSIIEALGDRSATIWELAKCTAKNTKARLLPVPTSFLEKLLPSALLRLLPTALRSMDASTPDKNNGRPADEVWELPFCLPTDEIDRSP